VDFGGWLRLARDEQAITLGALRLQPFTVPHDAREPLQLTCSDGDATLGILTDLGHVTGHVAHHLQNCTALLLECNHDPDMVALSAYPAFLKQRITGRLGHLANAQAAELLQRVRHGALRQVVAAHLSAQNNRPELARGHSQLRSAVRTATSLWRGPKKERTGSQADAGSGRRCKRRAHEKSHPKVAFSIPEGNYLAALAAAGAASAAGAEAAGAAAEAAASGAGAAAAGAGAGAGASAFLPQADRATTPTRVARTSSLFI